MTADFAFRLGIAATEALRQDDQPQKFLIGTDTRRSGQMLAHAITAGITSRGGDVHWLGIMPTPGVSHLTQQLAATAGIVISASHNPFSDNGIKFFNADGQKLSDELEARIETILLSDLDSLPPVTGRQIGHADRYRLEEEHYYKFLLANAPYLDGLKVGLDCANGAAFQLAPAIFKQIGARIDVSFAEPDGQNINLGCGSTHPAALQERVRSLGLDVGVSFDGDADRALLVDSRGRLVTGDHMLALLAVTRNEKEVVGTVMTNLGTEKFLESHSITMHRADVGDRYVSEELRARNLQLGGEQSGHLLLLDRAPTGDGILTALQVLSAVRTSGIPLEQWLDEIPVYPQTLHNVAVSEDTKHGLARHPLVLDAVSAAQHELAGDGRINLRPSGTEPLVRIMVEGPELSLVTSTAEKIARAVESAAQIMKGTAAVDIMEAGQV
jgi:phosphoglucosamine mutase